MDGTAPDFSMLLLVIFVSIMGFFVLYLAWNMPTHEEKVTLNSLDPNDTTEYIVFVEKTDDGYTLSKRNDKGEYIELDHTNTIQSIKE